MCCSPWVVESWTQLSDRTTNLNFVILSYLAPVKTCGLPYSSVGKETAFSARDTGSILGQEDLLEKG